MSLSPARLIPRGLVIAFALTVLGCAPFSGGTNQPLKIAPPDRFIGEWTGSARVIVCTCSRGTVDVFLKILPRGDVMGRVGDASIRRGYLARNNGWVGRFFNVSTDYVIVGNLAGSIVKETGVAHSNITIPVIIRDKAILGEIQAGEREVERTRALPFSATDMTLSRTRAYN